MKKIKIIMVLIAMYFLLSLAFSKILHGISSKSEIRFSSIYSRQIDADILILGNSRAVNSFYAPYFEKKIGRRTYNLGYNGQDFYVSKIFLADYLERNRHPKIIFIEITCINDSVGDLPIYKQYLDDSKRIASAIKKENPKIYYSSMIFRTFLYNSEYFLRTLYYLGRSDQSWINNYTITKAQYDGIDNSVKKHPLFHDITSETAHQFADFVDQQKRMGIQVVPVLAPIIDKLRARIDLEKYVHDFEYKTFTQIIDLSSSINDISMFADTVHTNRKGAVKLADIILNQKRIREILYGAN